MKKLISNPTFISVLGGFAVYMASGVLAGIGMILLDGTSPEDVTRLREFQKTVILSSLVISVIIGAGVTFLKRRSFATQGSLIMHIMMNSFAAIALPLFFILLESIE